MILNSHIHDQLTTAQRRDALEAAEQARLLAQVRPTRLRTRVRQDLPPAFRLPRTRRRAPLGTGPCTANTGR